VRIKNDKLRKPSSDELRKQIIDEAELSIFAYVGFILFLGVGLGVGILLNISFIILSVICFLGFGLHTLSQKLDKTRLEIREIEKLLNVFFVNYMEEKIEWKKIKKKSKKKKDMK